VTWQPVLAPHVDHDGLGERVSFAGAVAGLVELVRGLPVGVVVEKPVEQSDGVGVGLAGLPCGGRDRHGQAGCGAAAEADVQVDLVGLGQGDVLDHQPGHAFAFPRRGGRIGPERGEVGGQRADAGLVLLAESLGGLCGCGVVVVFGGAQGAQRVVPVGFQAVGDEPVVRVDGQVAAAGQVGVLAGSFDVAAAQRVGFVGAGLEFGLHGQGDVEGERGDGVEQQLTYRSVDRRAGHGQAARSAGVDAGAHAFVVGDLDAAADVVAHGHPPPASPADR